MRRAGLLLALLLAGCATAEPPRAPSERRCAPGAEAPTPLPPRDPAAREALIALGHARETAEVAEAIGAAPALRRLATLPPGAALERLRLRQEVTEAILQGLLDAAAAMAWRRSAEGPPARSLRPPAASAAVKHRPMGGPRRSRSPRRPSRRTPAPKPRRA
jgi:hypothetical protein